MKSSIAHTLLGKDLKNVSYTSPKKNKLLLAAYKDLFYEKLAQGLKEDLGDQYNDDDAEKAFQKLVNKLDEEGFSKKILDEYLQEKIKAERKKFLGSSHVHNHNEQRPR